MRYEINMIRSVREMERRAQQRRVFSLALSAIAIGLLALSFFYATLQVLTMESVLRQEKNKLKLVENEYEQYQETQQIVEKDDVELLDKLQNGKVFWTRILAAVAHYLPDNYWTTEFSFNSEVLNIKGEGYISRSQDQLVVLDKYIRSLENDPRFSSVFKSASLVSAERSSKEDNKIAFNISAERR
ncbi:MAG: hypothetical protein GF350_09630 [Chitinivibrionales bacterium]|nr:hypothetical protein [Chitinivibrionales bacterium]